jgi:aerobic carbon-monoxide dehydrogenase small subunit
MKVGLKVNGLMYEADVEPRKTLLDTLRDDFKLVGSHAGCEHGVCGACTVLIDGEPARACLMFAVQADGYEITTIEGLAPAPGELNVVQDAFCETHGLQCGYCTPGMILTAQALLNRNEQPSRADIVDAISGNICRCTGYGQIVEAIELAAERLRKANAPRNERGAHPNAPMVDPLAATDAPQQGVLEAAEADTPHGGRP